MECKVSLADGISRIIILSAVSFTFSLLHFWIRLTSLFNVYKRDIYKLMSGISNILSIVNLSQDIVMLSGGEGAADPLQMGFKPSPHLRQQTSKLLSTGARGGTSSNRYPGATPGGNPRTSKSPGGGGGGGDIPLYENHLRSSSSPSTSATTDGCGGTGPRRCVHQHHLSHDVPGSQQLYHPQLHYHHLVQHQPHYHRLHQPQYDVRPSSAGAVVLSEDQLMQMQMQTSQQNVYAEIEDVQQQVPATRQQFLHHQLMMNNNRQNSSNASTPSSRTSIPSFAV